MHQKMLIWYLNVLLNTLVETYLNWFEIELFLNINVFTDICDQFNFAE